MNSASNLFIFSNQKDDSLKKRVLTFFLITTYLTNFNLSYSSDRYKEFETSSKSQTTTTPSNLNNNNNQDSNITTTNYLIPSEEEIANAEEISIGSIMIPSESTITQFIKEESLELQTKNSGQESYSGETQPRIGLSIDGGGIRGVMPSLWLQDLKSAYEEDGESGIDDSLHEIFDYVGGTSIGGIVSLGVAKGLHPDTIVDLFDNAENRQKIFSTEGRKVARFLDFFGLYGYRYSADNLVTLLKETFGEDQKLSDLETNVLITACTTKGTPWIFKKENDNNEDYRLWEVARSTSAAPTYFEAYKPLFTKVQDDYIPHPALVDGGIWVNNPSTLVTASLIKEFHGGIFNPSKVHILSLGTGDTNIQGIPVSSGKLAAGGIIEALMSSHSRGNHMLMSQLLGNNYHRVNASMNQVIDLADVSDSAYTTMQGYAAQKEHSDKIKAFVSQTLDLIRKKMDRQD